MIVRPLGVQHGSALAILDRVCFLDFWSLTQYLEELNHKDSISLGKLVGKGLIAAVLGRLVFDELWVMRILTHPEHRRQGFAQELLFHLQLQAGQKKLAQLMWLEVAHDNKPAIKLYLKSGFEQVGERKNYYPATTNHKNKRNALILRKRRMKR